MDIVLFNTKRKGKKKMNRQKVIALRIELNRMIMLNQESIKLQEEKFGIKDNMTIPYLTGFSDAYRVIYDKLGKEA
jgi:hypothetical protein